IYTRQSVSDFDASGHAKGPSLDQQYDSIIRQAAFQGMTVESFQDADRSGKEVSRRTGYQAMIRRIETAASGEVFAIGCYTADRLHRNALGFYELMRLCEAKGIAVYESTGPIQTEDELSWGVKAVVASAERRRIAKRTRDNLQYLKQRGQLLGHAPVGYQRVDGQHPALIDAAIFEACQGIRARNQRRMKKAFRRYEYPLAPLLYCGRCGGKMNGETQGAAPWRKNPKTYYGCSHRRKQSPRALIE